MSHSDCFNPLTAKCLRLLLAMWPALFWLSAPAAAQCSLTCNDGLQVSLDGSGQALITIQMIAPTAASTCPGVLQLRLFTPQGVLIPNNTLTCAHIGQTITAQVKHLASGNSCSGTLEVQDALPPTVVCTDKFVFCNHDPSPVAVGFPTMTDNCTPSNALNYTYSDDITTLPCGTLQNGQPVNKRIDRTWSVSDDYGNTTTCLQKIWLKHITLANVTFPPNLDGIAGPPLNCGQDPDDLMLTGQPTVEGVPIDNSPDCEFGVAYADQIINICPPAGYSVIRTWTAVDFCSGTVMNRLQIIKIEDTTPPVVTPPDDLTVGTDGITCTGTVELPPAVTSDDCSAVTVTATWAFGTGFGPFPGVSAGTHIVTYTATDACGNSTTATINITVADTGPPQAICAGGLQVSLSSVGVGFVSAGSLNTGSYDNCGPVTLSISRDDSLFTAAVQVTCADIGPLLPLTLRVTDAGGLENFCTAEVSVRDFLKPTLQCPANVTLDCLQDYTDQQLTGQATASDNCALQSLVFADVLNIGPCNVGSVARVWTATDSSGNTRVCTQQIVLQALSTVEVVFPANVTVSVCADPAATLPPATGQPVTSGQYCSPLSVTYTDQIFNTALLPACWRIFRAWEVIDFCIYNPNDDSTGVWEQTQIIDIVDDVPPVLLLPPDLILNADQAGCQALATLPDVSATDCSDQIFISNNHIFADSAGANASGAYPLGVHQIVFTATDGCGNSSQQTLTLTVQDLAPPSAVCKSEIGVNLDSAGVATLQAALLDGGSTDNCSPAASLSFSASPNIFSCQTLGNQQAALTVTDAAGNAATCSVLVNVADSLGACLPPPPLDFSIEGTIRTEKGVPVAEIPLTLTGDGFFANANCDSSGHYFFEDVPANDFYTLKPSNNAEWLNGVTTFDLVQISKHILGFDTLDSPFKLIAADANRSGSVTTFDIVVLRKVILGITDSVPGNTSWRFVDAAYIFPDSTDPFIAVFPEQIVFNNLTANQSGQDFVGLKTGDMNNSTDAANPRSPFDTLFLSVPNLVLNAGQTTAVPVSLNDWAALEGFQFELSLDTQTVALQKVEFARPDLFGKAHFFVHKNGKLAVSWDNATGEKSPTGDPLLFTLHLSAKRRSEVSASLKLDATRLLSEAYKFEDELLAALGLRFGNDLPAKSEMFALWSSRPNPFMHETVVPFWLPGASELVLIVADVSGKTVLTKKATFPAGRGAWRIRREDLQGAGVYTYRVFSPTGQGGGGVMVLLGE